MESTSVLVVVLAALRLLLTAVAAAPAPPHATPTTTAGIYVCSPTHASSIEECRLSGGQRVNRTKEDLNLLCNDPSQLVVYKDTEDGYGQLLPFRKIKNPRKTGTESKAVCAPEHVQLEIKNHQHDVFVKIWHLVWDGVPNHDEDCDAPDTTLVHRSKCDTPKNCKKPRYRCAPHRIMYEVQDITICNLGVDTHMERCS